MEDGIAQKRALVVDDDDDICRMLAMLLRRHGYLVETASSAFEAIEKFTVTRSAGFCLVISDIGMPGMNGYELARKLRTLQGCKTTVMIALTGFSIYGDRKRALDAGFNDLVVKPYGARGLIALIDRLNTNRK